MEECNRSMRNPSILYSLFFTVSSLAAEHAPIKKRIGPQAALSDFELGASDPGEHPLAV